jgi:hypothetical protein
MVQKQTITAHFSYLAKTEINNLSEYDLYFNVNSQFVGKIELKCLVLI